MPPSPHSDRYVIAFYRTFLYCPSPEVLSYVPVTKTCLEPDRLYFSVGFVLADWLIEFLGCKTYISGLNFDPLDCC